LGRVDVDQGGDQTNNGISRAWSALINPVVVKTKGNLQENAIRQPNVVSFIFPSEPG
jgi:hypothetical protein